MTIHTIAADARGQFDDSLFNFPVDEEDFRQFARDNKPPPTWHECEIRHPYCRDEWHNLGQLPPK